ncbi:MAG TPA: deoxyribose-phosphate aldolase [Methylomusa anaerophila]|uniref:Deoxyribose-phosphate aldolase n=1 Tax=Methylomusa anaerophila TaxID=1930071 RepID=A0A348AGN9_9FIRM|nr:deoxyribose-phosphate aldolase [Methylomusa anaerophila]BBB90237.1 deoxyribose-phosphate aldolase [Methylomusa anaerophila]HML89415.1 deoxyribose-phosphate aldolase [Methylomusa anaerophila]
MNLASYIDHTLLRPDAVVADITRLCQEALEQKFAAVCVNPCYVDQAAHFLAGTGVKTAAVIGFPLGANLTAVKAFEAAEAIKYKADELDMVINIAAAKSGQWQAVEEDIRQVVAAAGGNLVKVIIETGFLTDEEKRHACDAILKAGAHFVKTSTGFGPGGATIEDIRLLKEIVGDSLGIKAAGGIRNRQQAEEMIAAGATRIGTSSGVEIVRP